MPIVRKLNPEEVATIERKKIGIRRVTEEQYDAYIRGYMPGEYGEALLDEGENKITERNRLKAAGERNGLTLRFRRTKDNRLLFKVDAAMGEQNTDEQEQQQEQHKEASPEPEGAVEVPAPQPKKGRRKSQVA